MDNYLECDFSSLIMYLLQISPTPYFTYYRPNGAYGANRLRDWVGNYYRPDGANKGLRGIYYRPNGAYGADRFRDWVGNYYRPNVADRANRDWEGLGGIYYRPNGADGANRLRMGGELGD